MLDLLTRLINHFMPQARNGLCWTRFCHHQQTSWGKASRRSSRGARTPASLALEGACGRPGSPDRLPSPDCPQIMQLLTKGNRQRTQEPTATNKTSSRSHAVLQVTVRRRGRGAHLAEEVRVGRLFMVDLAGSERASQVRVLSVPVRQPLRPRRLQHLEQRPAQGRRPPSVCRANASSAGAGGQAVSEGSRAAGPEGTRDKDGRHPGPPSGSSRPLGAAGRQTCELIMKHREARALRFGVKRRLWSPEEGGPQGRVRKVTRSSVGERKPLRRRERCLRGGCRDVRRGPAHSQPAHHRGPARPAPSPAHPLRSRPAPAPH